MKKWIAFLLVLVMCLSLCACGSSQSASENNLQDDQHPLVGRWEIESAILNNPIPYDDRPFFGISTTGFYSLVDEIQFFSDGTCTAPDGGSDYDEAYIEYEYEYSDDGQSIVLKVTAIVIDGASEAANGTTEPIKFSISGDELTLVSSMGTATFTRAD